MAFVHPLHQHPLNLQVEAAISATECCSVCDEKLVGEIYVCNARGCNAGFQVHKSCALPAPKVQHYLHPCPLIPRTGAPGDFCDACFGSRSLDLFYSCKECKFRLDIPCSKFPTPDELQSPSGQGKKLLHFSHGHPLTIFVKPQELFDDHNESCLCRICGEPFSSAAENFSIVGCNACSFFLHGPCLGLLPQRIRLSSFHPCDLILYAPLSKPTVFYPKADPKQALMFRCGRCHFNLCMPCWLSPKTASQHRALPRDTLSRQKVCSVCGRICTALSQETDGVNRSVLQVLTQQFQQHVSHTSWPLPLVDLLGMGMQQTRCGLCLGWCGDYAFLCSLEECRLSLHRECASLKPTVTSSDHQHPLTVVDKIHDDGVQLQCSRCSKSCSKYSVLRCQVHRCNYTIHIWCGPLPCNIRHPVHVHPLALKDYLANDDDEDDEEKSFCCHFCEKTRDPRLSVYGCEQGCPMICEVQCVASEVIAMLRGQRGNEVKLRIVGQVYQRTCKISTDIDLLKEVANTANTGVENQGILPAVAFRHVLSAMGYYYDRRWEPDDLPSYSRELRTLERSFVVSEEAFRELISRLQAYDVTDETAPDSFFGNVFRVVWDASRGEDLEDFFRRVVEQCPDVFQRIQSASIDEGIQKLVFFIVVEVIEAMITTKVADIDEEKLQDWWGYLNWIQQAGVNIDFMFDPLKRVASAYFGIRATSLVVEKERELEEITKEMDRLRIKAEAVKKQRDIYRMSLRNQTPFIKQCLKDARSLRWKPAVQALRDASPSSSDNDLEQLTNTLRPFFDLGNYQI